MRSSLKTELEQTGATGANPAASVCSAPLLLGERTTGAPEQGSSLQTGAEQIQPGEVVVRACQSYRCLEVTPYRRRDGTASAVANFVSECTDCGAEFVLCGSATTFGTRHLNRRCAGCKRPGRRVRKESTHAQP